MDGSCLAVMSSNETPSMRYDVIPLTPSQPGTNISSPPTHSAAHPKTPGTAPDSAMPPSNPTPSSAVRASPVAIQAGAVPQGAVAGAPAPMPSTSYPQDFSNLKVRLSKSEAF